MPVYKNNRGWYARINYTNEYGEHKTKSSKFFQTKREAKDAEILLANAVNNKKVSSSNITFRQAYEEFYDWKKDNIKGSTLRSYPPLWKHCTPLYDIKINKLTVPVYKAFKRELDNTPLSIDRKNRIHKMLCQIVSYAKSQYDVTTDVLDRVGGYKEPEKIRVRKVDFYTFDEFQRFIKNINDPVYHAFFMLLYYHGLRLGEANALTWHDIDFKQHLLTINKSVNNKIKGVPFVITSTKKSASDRVLPLEKETEQELKALKEIYYKYANFSEDWFVFGGARPLGDTNITNVKNRCADSIGLKRIRIHDFRHSCASFLIELGCPPMVVQKYLGHANVSITLNTYSHMYPSQLEQATALIEKYKNSHK